MIREKKIIVFMLKILMFIIKDGLMYRYILKKKMNAGAVLIEQISYYKLHLCHVTFYFLFLVCQ